MDIIRLRADMSLRVFSDLYRSSFQLWNRILAVPVTCESGLYAIFELVLQTEIQFDELGPRSHRSFTVFQSHRSRHRRGELCSFLQIYRRRFRFLY